MLKAIAVAALLAAAPAQAMAWDVDAMNRQVDETNFLVNDGCSATLVHVADGLLLTAEHCLPRLAGTSRFAPGKVHTLYFDEDGAEVARISLSYEVVRAVRGLDLGLIRVSPALLHGREEAPVACAPFRRGDASYTVGNPGGALYATVAPGAISSVNRTLRSIGVPSVSEDHALVQTTSPVGGGNSGGALYNDRGELGGVVVRGARQVSPVGFAVPLKAVREFLRGAVPACE